MHESVNIAHALSIAAGTIFLAAAVAKSVAREGVERFVVDIGVPQKWATTVIAAAVAVEVIVGVGLWSGAAPFATDVAASALAIVFIVLQARGLRVASHPCNCFGVLTAERSHHAGLLRAAVLFAASLGAAVATARDGANIAGSFPARADWFAGVAFAATILLASALLDQALWFSNARLRGAMIR
jgi:methylamine utilization protein MauE